MQKIPSLDELHKECVNVMDDESVTKISNWTEPPTDNLCNEWIYRDRGVANAVKLNAKMEEVLSLD